MAGRSVVSASRLAAALKSKLERAASCLGAAKDAKSGQGAAGLSGQLYQTLVQNDTTQAGNIGKSISSLAAALNGKTQTNLGGNTVTVT